MHNPSFRRMPRINGDSRTYEVYATGPTGRVVLCSIADEAEADRLVGFLNETVDRIRKGEGLDDILGKQED